MKQGEKILPHPDILNEVEYGPFVLTNLAAKRAKQIKEGAPPLIRIDSGHPLSIALAEIAAGKIKPLMAAEATEAVEAGDLSALDALDLPDVGLLLPAIEEDIDLAAIEGLEDEEELDAEADLAEVAELGDLLEDEPVAPLTDDTEISLDDLAVQEEGEGEPSEDDDLN
ncbi:MAG: DNA-directed RNA polymerase subunit omega [Fimbriimonadaceae bacterium]|nr:DNA-directed RNA polymerase subunit omega [Fimbriimonadaceae bacterium]QYK59218.1 MAG: DNA-directed RNA polymerase subunit omega [Fimbriimonadaceae bacterium]